MKKPSNKINEAALHEYLDECAEMIERASRNIASIEAGDVATATLSALYREMHTIKGSSQLFGFAQAAQLAHAMESSLDPIRKGLSKVEPTLIDQLYRGIDIIAKLSAGIRRSGEEPDMQADLMRVLPRLIAATEASLAGGGWLGKEDRTVLDGTEAVGNQAGNDVTRTDEATLANNASKPTEDNAAFGFFDDAPTTPVEAKKVERPTPPAARDAAEPNAKIAAEDQQAETIRVHVSLLDSLMNLVGELVLIRNQLLQYAKANNDDVEFAKVSQRLNVLTAELQNEVMKTRMQPLGNVLNKFTRVVRDMGKELGKRIDLEIQGAETELDKTILESVRDPLTHIIRNAVDHGVESAEERLAANKPEVAKIRLQAHHESGQVIIEIADDGRGLSRQRIGAKAIEKGLVTTEALAKMTDREVQGLIFTPGFSTVDAVSSISGRGVGMDVVRTNVERIGGIVELNSVEHEGTCIRLKIPLSLAIVPALIVRSAGQRFAIPQSKLVELLRIDRSEGAGEQVESLQGRPVLRLRGALLPLVQLSEILSMGAAQPKSVQARDLGSSVVNVVVLSADAFQFGLMVDEIEDSADIVVKAMSQFLKDLRIFSGATIMGDGAVALTIDVMGVAETVRQDAGGGDADVGMKKHEASKRDAAADETAEFLLVNVGAPGSYAIPMSVVSRLEEFDGARVEYSGEQRVVRYRDSLLPLISLPEFLQLPFERAQTEAERFSVVVVRRGDQSFGVVVDDIQDVAKLPARVEQGVRDRPGILGSLISQEKVIVVVDIFGVIDAAQARMTRGDGAASAPDAPVDHLSKRLRGKHRILVVEDSSFFRSYIANVLQESGYLVDKAADGAEAIALLEQSKSRFSLVLSDIEMPNVDGLELARRVRAIPALKGLPLVAITTLFGKRDIETGMAAGFNAYLKKLNAEILIKELDAFLCQGETEVKHASNS